ncbi:MAG: ATP-binding protein, partial [Lachnospiraceae bacterium]|nr:ATP-binding protein [Lachnospiraceae bacterium]
VQMQREIEEIQDVYADMRGLRHDMKSHLESIAAVIRKISGKDKEELDSYIEKMETTVSRLDFAYRTGNPITDVIIHQKKQEAEKRNISFEADFTYPDKQQIDVYDIGIVLNNALENAIEASSNATGKKSISLRSYMKGNLFFIEVENDFWGEIIFDSETGLPVSSKADKQLHGLGMENIQRCARKYMGGIDISIHDMGNRKKFNLTIMMYEKYFTP